MRLRISQAAAVIPAAGYALLWSDFAEKSLSYQWRLQNGAWFTVPERLTLVYVGALLLTVALLISFLRSPRMIRRHAEVEDAISEYEQAADKATRKTIIDAVGKFVSSDQDGSNARFTETVNALVKAELQPRDVRQAYMERPKAEPRTLVRAYYLQNEDSNFGSLVITSIVVVMGTGMLFAPAAEVMYLVLRMLLFRAVS